MRSRSNPMSGSGSRFAPFSLFLAAVLAVPPGCLQPFDRIDGSLAAEARHALFQERPPPAGDEEENVKPYHEKSEQTKSVFVGVLLAFFPGLFWHGLGHRYAGDDQTADEIQRAGEWGYLLTAIGAGMVTGGYFLDKNSNDTWHPYAISLYVAGGITGAVGVGFFLTAWIYDMVDTPRAVKSGGEPPAHGLFHKDMEEIGK